MAREPARRSGPTWTVLYSPPGESLEDVAVTDAATRPPLLRPVRILRWAARYCARRAKRCFELVCIMSSNSISSNVTFTVTLIGIVWSLVGMSRDQNALLTETQREYLRGEHTDLSDAGKRMKRKRIRDRIQASLTDLALLASALPGSDDFDMIFDDFQGWNEYQRELSRRASDDGPLRGAAPPEGAEDGRQMTRSIHGAVSFLYLAVSGYGGGGVEGFESVVATAIENAEMTDKERVEATVDIDLTREPRPTDLIRKYEAGEKLTEEEYLTLVEAGEIDAVDLLKREGFLVDDSDE